MINKLAIGAEEVQRSFVNGLKERKRGGIEKGESGSLVQAAGSAAFLSPEMGEQQSRNVPRRERGDLSRGKEKGKKEQEKKKGEGKLDAFAVRGLKWWNRLIYQMKFEKAKTHLLRSTWKL